MEDMGVVDKIKGFMFNPTETFKKFREETLGDSLRYYVILLVIYSLLSAVMVMVLWNTVWGFMYSGYKFIPGFEALYESGFGIIIVIVLFVIFFISGLIGIFVGGGIIHLGVLLFGGKRGKVPFPHHQHQNNLGDCKICHSVFPQKSGIIEKLKSEGKLKKKYVMNKLCTKCHKEKKKAGEKSGPVACAKCHIKEKT